MALGCLWLGLASSPSVASPQIPSPQQKPPAGWYPTAGISHTPAPRTPASPLVRRQRSVAARGWAPWQSYGFEGTNLGKSGKFWRDLWEIWGIVLSVLSVWHPICGKYWRGISCKRSQKKPVPDLGHSIISWSGIRDRGIISDEGQPHLKLNIPYHIP